jgi:outer membrane protein
MKKIAFFIIVLSLFAFKTEGVDLKIGYVDFNKALNESDNGKKAVKIIENMANIKQEIMLEKEAEINKLKEELEKQASVLTPESRRDKEDHLNKLIRDAQRMVSDFQEEIQKKQAGFIQEMQKDLIEIINKIGEEEGYSVIFERGASGILYSQKKFDITDKAIKRYNQFTKAK